MAGPLYSSVMALHVLAAVVGFGALGATGAYAAGLRRDPAGALGAARRYFRPGRNWAARAILAVPVLGGVLLALGQGRDVGKAFPWVGLGLWLLATGIASWILWPAEAEVQRLLALGEAGEAGEKVLVAACARCERAAMVTSVLFVVALAVMVVQP